MDQQNAHTVLGRSFLLEAGDLVLVDGDLAVVAGRDNFLQGLRVMIDTGFGTDVFNVSYGLDAQTIFTSTQTVSAIKDVIRLNIVKSVSQDNRVKQIDEVVFDDEDRYYQLLPAENAGANEAARRNPRQWQALIVLQAVAEGEVALRLEGTGLNT